MTDQSSTHRYTERPGHEDITKVTDDVLIKNLRGLARGLRDKVTDLGSVNEVINQAMEDDIDLVLMEAARRLEAPKEMAGPSFRSR